MCVYWDDAVTITITVTINEQYYSMTPAEIHMKKCTTGTKIVHMTGTHIARRTLSGVIERNMINTNKEQGQGQLNDRRQVVLLGIVALGKTSLLTLVPPCYDTQQYSQYFSGYLFPYFSFFRFSFSLFLFFIVFRSFSLLMYLGSWRECSTIYVFFSHGTHCHQPLR